MQILKAQSTLTGDSSRQNLHTSAKRGNWVKVVVEGGIQVRSEAGKFTHLYPSVRPTCWVRMEDVLKLKDLRRPRGRPLKVVETYKGKSRTLTIKPE